MTKNLRQSIADLKLEIDRLLLKHSECIEQMKSAHAKDIAQYML